MSGESGQTNPKYQLNEDGTLMVADQQVTLDELAAGYLRQSDYTRKTQDLANQKRELETAEKLMDNLRSNPAGTLKSLSQSLGVNLGQPAQQAAPPTPQPQPHSDDWDNWDDSGQRQQTTQADPQVAQLTQVVEGLMSEVRTLRQSTAEQSIHSEMGSVKAQYPDLEIDEGAVIRHATVNAIPSIDLAVRDLYKDDLLALHVKNMQAQQGDEVITDQKRTASAAVAAQAGVSPTGSTTISQPIPDGDEGLDFSAALAESLSELGVSDMTQINFDDTVVSSY